MDKKDAIIVFSGGLDSTTLLYDYLNKIKIAVSFNYGSKHNEIELQKAKEICNNLNVKHIIIELPFIGELFQSNLLKKGGEIPLGEYNESNMSQTVVPFRNGIMLSIVAGLAESFKLNTVLIGSHFGDHSIYPDCTEEFTDYMSLAVRKGTANGVTVFAPYARLSKREIALKGKHIRVPFEKTYSCYKGGEVHCGRCATCIERKEALMGFDNTNYQL